jgi:N-acetylneuraminic acid mutarotase
MDYPEYSYENPFDVMTWTIGANMPDSVYGCVTAFYNGQLFRSHGRRSNALPYNTAACKAYNPSTNTWTTKATAPTARRMVAAGVMQDGQYMYAIGGRFDAVTTVGTNERYNMVTDTWETLAPCTPRWAHGGAVVGGYAYVFGGPDATTNLSCQKYDPATNTWSTMANLPAARGWTCGASLNGKVYCIGGSAANTLYEYDPALNAWTVKAPMPSVKTYCHAAGDQSLNKIFVFGGTAATAPTTDVWVWDAATNTWSTETVMPGARNWAGVGNDGAGRFFVLGGFDGVAAYYFNTWIGNTTPPVLNLNVVMTPINPPISIPSTGGSFNFNAAVTNNGTQAPFWAWARNRYPDGTYTGVLLGPVNINPPTGVTVQRTRTQVVPAGWPAGLHYMIGYAGSSVGYPAADADSFSWTKTVVPGAGPIVWEAYNYGEPFPGEVITMPETHTVLGNYPNPFNPSTTISYTLNLSGNVQLAVYDVNGREVAKLVNGYVQAGNHSVTFDGSNLASGVYVYTLSANGQTATAKMVLMK